MGHVTSYDHLWGTSEPEVDRKWAGSELEVGPGYENIKSYIVNFAAEKYWDTGQKLLSHNSDIFFFQLVPIFDDTISFVNVDNFSYLLWISQVNKTILLKTYDEFYIFINANICSFYNTIFDKCKWNKMGQR